MIGEDNGCALFCINKYSAPSLHSPLIPPHQHCQRHENELRLETRDIYEEVDTYYANTGGSVYLLLRKLIPKVEKEVLSSCSYVSQL